MSSEVDTDKRLTLISPEIGTSGFHASVTGSTYRFSFSADERGLETLKRAVGGAIMALLPPDALDHALEALQGYYTFYAEDQQLATSRGLMLLPGEDEDSEESDLVSGYGVD